MLHSREPITAFVAVAAFTLATPGWGVTPPPPPEVSSLHYSGTTLSWAPVAGAVGYRYYRANLSDLPNYCATSVLTTSETSIDDTEIPPAGTGFAYLASAVNSAGEGSLGIGQGGTLRNTLLDCDVDLDGSRDGTDNCPLDANINQQDADSNGVGDVCDFPSQGVELLGRMTFRDFPGFEVLANEIGSYVSPAGEEYAIIGFRKGTGFARVTDPTQPGLSGYVPDPPVDRAVRDFTVRGHYVYIVSDNDGTGLQVVDLSNIDNDIVTLVNTTELAMGFTEAHNIFANEESGYLYLAAPDLNDGLGITAVDVNLDPENPTVAGFWVDADPNVRCHDFYVQTYTSGPNGGKEIAYCFAEDDGVLVVDVTDKNNMFRLSGGLYPDPRYAHQGWLSKDLRYLLIGDELDEFQIPKTTTTYVVDVLDASNPVFVTEFTNGLPSIDHNMRVSGDFVYEGNYSSGLRVYSLCNVNNVQEVGSFDTRPEDDDPTFNGAWGADVLPSGTVVVSDRQRGLFVLDASAAIEAFNDKCAAGDPLDPVCDNCVSKVCTVDPACCSTAWDATCVEQVRTVCNSLACAEAAGSCSHTPCTEGPGLVAGCDVPPATTSCTEAICLVDPDCCLVAWDTDCVAAVATVCGSNCD